MKAKIKSRALRIVVGSQKTKRPFIISLTTLFRLTLCSNTTTAQGLPANNWSPIHGEQGWCLACCSHFPIKYNSTVH